MSEKALSPARHEPSDVGGRFIWIGVALLLATVLFLALLVLWLFPVSDQDIRLPLPTYPNPQLQPDPRADMARFYAGEMRWLNGTGWIDKAHGVAHIPISDAMRLVAKEGIADWPAPTEKPQ